MEEFQSEEEEPWYDQQDLEQGKDGEHPASCQEWQASGMRGQKRGQIPGTGGWDTFPQDSYWLGEAGTWSCGGSSVEISAPLLQTTVPVEES